MLVYGRRRVGKTGLLQKFMWDKHGLHLYVPNAEEKTILAELHLPARVQGRASHSLHAKSRLGTTP